MESNIGDQGMSSEGLRDEQTKQMDTKCSLDRLRPNESSTSYPSRPLSPDSTEFRLLRILPSPDLEAPVRILLDIHCFEPLPEYEALSYTWGEPLQNRKVFVNGQKMPVTGNLAAALRRLRRRDEVRTM